MGHCPLPYEIVKSLNKVVGKQEKKKFYIFTDITHTHTLPQEGKGIKVRTDEMKVRMKEMKVR